MTLVPSQNRFGPHCVPAGATASGGQSRDTPSQSSATSHGPAAGRHIVCADCGMHVPEAHVAHTPLHDWLQQTPLTQNPEAHWEGPEHGWPLAAPPPLGTQVPF
jgi:hypothetical protein